MQRSMILRRTLLVLSALCFCASVARSRRSVQDPTTPTIRTTITTCKLATSPACRRCRRRVAGADPCRPHRALHRQRRQAAQAALNPKVEPRARCARSRSTRLEEGHRRTTWPTAQADRRDALPGRPDARAVRLLLSRDGDIVIAGSGRRLGRRPGGPRSRHEQRPAGRRAARPDRGLAGIRPGRGTRRAPIGCSIDPTQEGLAACSSSCSAWAREPRRARHAVHRQGLRNSLGLQTVAHHGRPAHDALRPGAWSRPTTA